MVLKLSKDTNKLICLKCLEIYNPHYELVKVQETKTMIDELSVQEELNFHKETQRQYKKNSQSLSSQTRIFRVCSI
jgi:ABC-type branched-subunit amino acid transport system ATPase component